MSDDVVLKLILFAGSTAGLVYLSRASLRAPRAHGFYRFFAWEFILVLIFLNIDHWFHNPFSTHQLVSWSLLSASAFLVVHGVSVLHRAGRPDRRRDDDAALIGIERTTVLVKEGAYAYIRHPIYCSGLLLTWGVFLKDPSWPSGILALMASLFLVITAKVEESECVRFFGAEYRGYIEQTKMFIPFVL